jgi:carboxylate-amine ligase
VLLEEIVELVRDEAMRLGCLPEVLRAREILDRGTSADRQLNVYARARAAGAGEREAAQAVVDCLIEETMVGIAPDAAITPA